MLSDEQKDISITKFNKMNVNSLVATSSKSESISKEGKS